MTPMNKTQSPHLKKPDTVVLHIEAPADATLLQREIVSAVCQNTFLTHTVNTKVREEKCASSAFLKPAATTKDEAVFSKTVGHSREPKHVAASSRLYIRERGLMIPRRAPETDLHPSLMILRSQQRAPEVATPQSLVSTAGRLLVLLGLIWHFVAFLPASK